MPLVLLATLLAAGRAPSRLALTISGGVSLGSYEAGLTWASVRELRNRHAGLAAVTGASAGAVNALLAAALWCEDPSEDRDDGPDDNLLHDTWAGIGLEELLSASGAGDGLLSAAPLERGVERITALLRGRRFRPGCSLPVGWTVTRDQPEERSLEGLTARAQRFLVALKFEVDAAGTPRLSMADLPAGSESAADALVLATTRDGVGFDQAAQAILASTAFPFAFRPRELCDCALACPEADIASAGSCEGPYRGGRLQGLACPAPRQLCRRRYVDGGIFDNAPVGLAVDLLESQHERALPFQPATFVVVDPDLRRLEPRTPRPSSEPPAALTMMRNLIGTARERELLQTMRAESWQRNTVRTLAEAAQLHADLAELQQEMAGVAADAPAATLSARPELFRSPRREALGRFLLRCFTSLAPEAMPDTSSFGRCAGALRDGRVGEGPRLSPAEVAALGDAFAKMLEHGVSSADATIAEIGATATPLGQRVGRLSELLDGATVIVASFRFLAGELSALSQADLSEARLQALRRDLLATTEAKRFLRGTEAMLRAFAWAVLVEEGVAAADSSRAQAIAMLDGPMPEGVPDRVVRLAGLAARLRSLSGRADAISANATRLATGDAGERRLTVLRRFAPLGSGQLFNFSGFLDRGLRDVDFYIGVYDAVRIVANFTCEFQGAYRAEGRPAPVYRSDAPLELDLAAADTQRCVGLSMRSVFEELRLSRSPRAAFVIARLSRIELATLLRSRNAAARLMDEPAWSWLREPALAAGDPVRSALVALTSTTVACEPGAAEQLCLGEQGFDEFLESLRQAGYPAQSGPMRDALDDPERWQADMVATLMDRAAAAELRTQTPPDSLVAGVGLGELWSRRARVLSTSGFELDPSTIPGAAPRTFPAVAAHLLPYRISLDVARGGAAFSWLEPELRIGTHFALQSMPDLIAIDDGARFSTRLGGLAAARFSGLSFGIGAQTTLPWNGDRVLPPGPVMRLGWLQDRIALTARLSSMEEGHRQASLVLSVADLNGLAYWLALWAAGR